MIVVGCGGVGSHAAHMLARSGVKRLRLIDGDNVTLSSLNRAATATRADVGSPKVLALQRAISSFAPQCAVEPVAAFLDASSTDELLRGAPSMVVDCIDDTEAKVALLLACARAGVRVVSSLGAGGAADPTRIRFCDLSHIHGDALGVTIKYALRRAGLCTTAPCGITALYLADEPRAGLLPLALGAGERAEDFGARAGVRVRIMPVFGPVPAVFGHALAAWALCALAGAAHALAPAEAPASSAKQLGKLRVRLERWEEAHAAHGPRRGATCGASDAEIGFVVDAVFHARSPVSHARLGARGVQLDVVRWRAWAPTVPSNLVLLTDDEALALAAAGADAGLRGLADAAIDAGADFNAAWRAPARDGSSSSSSSSSLDAALAALEAAWEEAVLACFGARAVATIDSRLEWARRVGWP